MFTHHLDTSMCLSASFTVSSSMTELEKDIVSLRSGLKSVEAVSELSRALGNLFSNV